MSDNPYGDTKPPSNSGSADHIVSAVIALAALGGLDIAAATIAPALEPQPDASNQ
jgi:hypothetical protein